MQVIEDYFEPADSLARIIVRFAFDPWIGMLSVGALGHRLGVPMLSKFGFLESVLVILVVQSYSSMSSRKKKVTTKEDK